MSTEKTERVIFRMSEDDRLKLKEVAQKWDCSESYVVRRALKLFFDTENEKEGNK